MFRSFFVPNVSEKCRDREYEPEDNIQRRGAHFEGAHLGSRYDSDYLRELQPDSNDGDNESTVRKASGFKVR